jgi:7-cyano-7-deazaguanine reductase
MMKKPQAKTGKKNATSAKLTQLGRQAGIPASPDAAILETVANPNKGKPDFAHIVIDYVPGSRIVESKSLKLYIASFRDHGSFHEDATISIASKIIKAAKPKWLRIGGFFNPRGGIPIDVFYQTGSPPKGVFIPDQGVNPYTGRK